EFWETFSGNPCWVVIDLKSVYLINRWEVQNIGAYGEGAESNASDYRLQYSLDCKNWKDADVVFGNTASVTSQKIEQITAQYVRLYVTRANRTSFESERDRCAICEFTVYGLKLGGGRTTDWTLMDLSSKSESGSSDKSSGTSYSSDPVSSASSTDTDSEINSAEDSPTTSESKPSDGNKEPEKKSGNGALIWIIIGVCALAVIGGAAAFIVIKKRKSN
ncbi:MAG: discoidin domain-containing protein, partial [Acutalibacteraceae bacterium]